MTSVRLLILIREERIPDQVGDDGKMLVGDDRNDIITFSPIVVNEEGKLAALGSRGRGPNEVWEGLVSPPH